MFNVKESIESRKAEGRKLVKFQVLGYGEKAEVTSQLNELGYSYEIINLREFGADKTPYNIIVEI